MSDALTLWRRAAFVVAALLALAVFEWPYGYFQFLRWATCLAALGGVWAALEDGTTSWALAFVGVAILFNPIAPISFSRGVWIVIDLFTALGFALAAWAVKPLASEKQNE